METIQNSSNSLHPVINDLLLKRGYKPEQFDDFFSWDLNSLPALTSLKDLEKASLRIISAIENQEKIGIYGDYDVDGTTSCALFFQFFKMIGVEVDLYQPSRFVEGYGIHPISIDNALSDGIKLLITVDCGISNVETAQYCIGKDIDLIITDHHKDTQENMPCAYAVVNPNRRDEPADSQLTSLAGVGVAFAVCLKVRELMLAKGKDVPSIYPLLQYVAIGTICDLAKLNPMNLKLTRHGLKQITTTEYSGIASFFNDEDRGAPFIPSEKISFYVGPLINSKGRLDHPEKALRLLVATNHREAFENYSQLEISNRERKIIQNDVFLGAKKQVIKTLKRENHLISIVYDPAWHEGVIGIVASKLVEVFHVPAIIFTDSEDKGIIKASARSAGVLDLFSCLKECEDLFLKFGGHKAAAGLSMNKENLPEFIKRMNELLSNIPEINRTKQEHFDALIKFDDINKKIVTELNTMEPFGMGNPKPVFLMSDARLESYTVLKDLHVKWVFVNANNPKNKIQGISFNFIGKWNCQSPEEIFNSQSDGLKVMFTIGINRFRGNETIQLMVENIHT